MEIAQDDPAFGLLKVRLKSDLCSTPANVAKRFGEIKPGENDYDAAFREWWLVERRDRGDAVVLVTDALDHAATQAGIEKYKSRLEAEARSVLPNVRGRKVIFELRGAEAGSNGQTQDGGP